MFIGHYAVGFAAKRFAPSISLGALFAAALWADLLWSPLLLFGVERVGISPEITEVSPFVFEYYPYSHSLVATAIWSALFALAGFVSYRCLRAALVLGAVVVSHWFLDAIVHLPDLPLSLAGGTRAGLGLWMSVPGTVIVEGGLFIASVALYLSYTRSIDNIGRYGAWALAVILAVIYAGQFSGSTPPNVTVIAVTGLAQWAFVLFGYWTDRHREAAGG